MSYFLLEQNPLLNARTRTLDRVIVLHNGLLLRYQVSIESLRSRHFWASDGNQEWAFRMPGTRFSKVPKTFRARKAIRKLRPAYSVKLVFSYVVKGIKIKITAKFRGSRRLRLEDTKRIMSPEIRPKSFGTFERQAPGRWSLPDFRTNRLHSWKDVWQ